MPRHVTGGAKRASRRPGSLMQAALASQRRCADDASRAARPSSVMLGKCRVATLSDQRGLARAGAVDDHVRVARGVLAQPLAPCSAIGRPGCLLRSRRLMIAAHEPGGALRAPRACAKLHAPLTSARSRRRAVTHRARAAGRIPAERAESGARPRATAGGRFARDSRMLKHCSREAARTPRPLRGRHARGGTPESAE